MEKTKRNVLVIKKILMLENVCTAIPQMDTIYLRKNAANKNITGTPTVNSAKK